MAKVLLTTEGTYPYFQGGVSVWCDTLVRELDDFEYHVLAIATTPYVQSLFGLPANVLELQGYPLWGIRDPAESRRDLTFSELFLRKQRTRTEVIRALFLPQFRVVLDGIAATEPDADAMGRAVGAMHRYFQTYDYLLTWRSAPVFELFRTWLAEAVAAGALPEPSVFDVVQALGWLYHFLMVLDVPIPRDTELVHASAAAFCGLVGVVAKLEYGIPYLLTEHGIYLREQYLSVGRSDMAAFGKRFLIRVVGAVVRMNYRHADRIAPVCAFNTRWERFLGAAAERIQVIYNGVSPELFAPATNRLPRDRVEIAVVARSDPNKDLETLLRAVAVMRTATRAAFHVSVYGSVTVPAYHERVLALRRELGLEGSVEFAGHTNEVARIYREADIVVQSSVSEAFPYALIEAMMSGTAVVATEVGGSAEAVGSAGLLVPAREPEALARAIVLLVENAPLRTRLGEEARERALTYFHRARSIGTYRQAYRTLLVRRATRRPDAGLLLALDRAMALDRAGYALAALDQLHRALRAAPATAPAAEAAVLAMIASLERRMGDSRRASRHLLAAWLLSRRGSGRRSA